MNDEPIDVNIEFEYYEHAHFRVSKILDDLENLIKEENDR